MAGVNQKVIGKRLFDFSGVAIGAQQTIVLQRAVPIFQWTEVALLARFHDDNNVSWSTGAQIQVRLIAEAYTDEDPNSDFLSSASDLADVTFVAGGSFPALGLAPALTSVASNYGGYLRVVVTATQGSSATTFQANLSIDLSLKA